MRFPPVIPGLFTWLLAGFVVSACGGSHDDVSKRLAAMQTDLTRLQNHSDRLEERLEAVEMRKEASVPVKIASDTSAPLERPRLMVVKLEPGDESRDTPSAAPTAELRPEDSAADQTPRPVIRVHGSHTDADSDGSDSPRHRR